MAASTTKIYVSAATPNTANTNLIIYDFDDGLTPKTVIVDYTQRIILGLDLLGVIANTANGMNQKMANLELMLVQSRVQSNQAGVIANQTGQIANSVNTIKEIILANTGIYVTGPYDHIGAIMTLSALSDANSVWKPDSNIVNVITLINSQKDNLKSYMDFS
jgi:hypothetical protein